MDMYWTIEYIKVGGGYLFLLFIWPLVVFWNYLKEKSRIFRFSFCVTVQIIIVNTVVLMLGLLHILNGKVVCGLFYGTFLISVVKIAVKSNVLQSVRFFKENIYSRIGEYTLLLIVIIYGMFYFSYGSFQIHSYGQYDTMIHHGWVNKMVEGQIFSEGIYPEAMHSFIYCLYALFGIRIYSIMLFLQCFHVVVFFLAAYCLMREVFRWRYSPILVLGLYLTMDFTVSSMARLQSTLPMEFGLHTQFLCALYLVKYLKNGKCNNTKNRVLKGVWDENLIVFAAALSASIATHYYTTIMAFIFCASFAVFNIRRIFRCRCLFPLIISVLCGCFIAVVPMIGAFISGTPFEASIHWGLNMIIENEKQADLDLEGVSKISDGPFALTVEDINTIEKLPDIGQKVIGRLIKTEYFIKEIYRKGYIIIYGKERGQRIFGVIVVVIFFCIINGLQRNKTTKHVSSDYPPLILVSFLSALVFVAYNSPELGLPVFIPNHRFAPPGHLATLAVLIMPVDIVFAFSTKVFSDKILQTISIVSIGGIYLLTKMLGIFHGYLYFTLMRYEAAAFVTDSIIEEFAQDSFTIVSPKDEVHHVELYGKHQEISEYITNCENEFYSLPTEYVFLYVEKRPIEYCQRFYFSGPSWLANSGNSEIKATQISKEAACEDMSEYANASWGLYMSGRTILESKAYEWCQRFAQKYPSELKVYYEDNDFICYYFKQDVEMPYNLAGE